MIRPKTVKILEENIRENLLTLILAISFWIWQQKYKKQKQKKKKKWNTSKKFLHSKRSNQQNKKTTNGIRENICKSLLDEGLICKYISNYYNTILKKSDLKIDRGPE